MSTPEILERVTTIESEILQIEEAIAIQGNDNLGLSTVGSQSFFSVLVFYKVQMTCFVFLPYGRWKIIKQSL